mgnify:CR=1 FL=1
MGGLQSGTGRPADHSGDRPYAGKAALDTVCASGLTISGLPTGRKPSVPLSVRLRHSHDKAERRVPHPFPADGAEFRATRPWQRGPLPLPPCGGGCGLPELSGTPPPGLPQSDLPLPLRASGRPGLTAPSVFCQSEAWAESRYTAASQRLLTSCASPLVISAIRMMWSCPSKRKAEE